MNITKHSTPVAYLKLLGKCYHLWQNFYFHYLMRKSKIYSFLDVFDCIIKSPFMLEETAHFKRQATQIFLHNSFKILVILS